MFDRVLTSSETYRIQFLKCGRRLVLFKNYFVEVYDILEKKKKIKIRVNTGTPVEIKILDNDIVIVNNNKDELIFYDFEIEKFLGKTYKFGMNINREESEDGENLIR